MKVMIQVYLRVIVHVIFRLNETNASKQLKKARTFNNYFFIDSTDFF